LTARTKQCGADFALALYSTTTSNCGLPIARGSIRVIDLDGSRDDYRLAFAARNARPGGPAPCTGESDDLAVSDCRPVEMVANREGYRHQHCPIVSRWIAVDNPITAQTDAVTRFDSTPRVRFEVPGHEWPDAANGSPWRSRVKSRKRSIVALSAAK
jgi:hypothetical protein